jgi:hypothetical protein
MSDKTAAFVDTHGLGRLLGRVALRGKLELSGLGAARAELCLTTRSLWVVATLNDGNGRAIDLLEEASLRYRRARLGDELGILGQPLAVSAGRSSKARGLIGVGRMRARLAAPLEPPSVDRFAGPFVEPPSQLERLYLQGVLGEGEVLVAWLAGDASAFITSPIETDAEAGLRLMMTSERADLVAISELGDTRVEALERARLELFLGGKRATLRTPNWEYTSRRKNAELVREVLGALEKPEPERLLWFARKYWQAGWTAVNDERTQRL